MKISLESAAYYFDVSTDTLYSNPKYSKFVQEKYFDIDLYNKTTIVTANENNFCIDMVNFSEFIISTIGEEIFYKRLPALKRQEVKRGIEKSKFPTSIANLIELTFSDEWIEKYRYIENNNYIPLEEREPLTFEYLKRHYWEDKKTTLEIADSINVPEGWVCKEIRRLGMQKKKNGIAHKGKKGYMMSEAQKAKRQKQPHAKAIVQICPKTYLIIKEYSSQGAVERYGHKRENVRKAIKSAGLSKGYLWAFKGLENITINVVKKRGTVEGKLQAFNYKKPTKWEFEKAYIIENKTSVECAELFKCHKGTIAALAREYGLKKRTGKISDAELEHLRVVKGLSAEEIGKQCGYSTSSIFTYLSRSGIKKG